MTSDDRLHKTRFCKKRGVLSGGVGQKEGGVTFFKGGFIPGAHDVVLQGLHFQKLSF